MLLAGASTVAGFGLEICPPIAPGREGANAFIDKTLLELAAQRLVEDRKHARQAQMPLPGLAEYLDLLYALHELAANDSAKQRDWMAALPLGAGTAGLDEAGLLAFARQAQAAQGGDDALIRRYHDAFGPLWGLVHRAADSEGEPLPQPGALPAEKLAHYRCKNYAFAILRRGSF